MTVEKFFALYANTPLIQRGQPINLIEHGFMTLREIDQRLHEIEDILRPHRIEEARLLRIAENHMIRSGTIV